MTRSQVREFVRKHPRLDELRRALRFYQAIPARDLAQPRKLRAAARARRHTMIAYPGLAQLHELASSLARDGVPGSVVQCGVWNGGSAAVMALASREAGWPREMWLFDSWEGLPEPADIDVSENGLRRERGWNLGFEEQVEELLFGRLGLHRDGVRLVKGWFEDTLPQHRDAVAPIALLHADADWYESTRTILENFYELVSPGGYIVFDDYGHWKGCARAVDEFVGRHRIELERQPDTGAAYLRKPGRE